MAKLRNDVFMYSPPPQAKAPQRFTAADRQALSGIGDRHLREAQSMATARYEEFARLAQPFDKPKKQEPEAQAAMA